MRDARGPGDVSPSRRGRCVRLGFPYCDSPLVGVVEQLLDAGAASKGLDEPPVVDLSKGHYLARMTTIS